MTYLTNINGHRDQVAKQLEAVVAKVAEDRFNVTTERSERGHYYRRITLLAELLRTIDDQVAHDL